MYNMMRTRNLKKLNIKHLPQKLFFGPEWIVLGVNNLCNLHCKMCDVGTGFRDSNFYHHLMGAQPLNMPLELIRRIIEQTAHFFPKARLGYAFTEPSIYPHFIESLRDANEKNLYTTVTTNALKLDVQARDLAEAGLNELFVSLDGPPEIHNRIRGHRRSFEKAFSGLEKLFSMKGHRPEVSVFCTITEWNTGHLFEFARHFRDVPLKRIGFMHTNFVSAEVAEKHNKSYGKTCPATVSNLEQVSLEKMDLPLLLDDIEKIKSTGFPFPITFSPEIDSLAGLKRFYFEPEKLIGSLCYDSFRNLMIKSDGAVIPAHGRCYRVDAGNIYQNTLKEIWHARALVAFRKTLIKAGGLLPACSRCCSAFD
jgi:MoaA/NifB/PqqE/SkfB family radical SAM enzyme